MALAYEFIAILFIILLLLGAVFTVGLILLIIGLITRWRARKKGLKKMYPKVLIGLALPLLILPAIAVVVPIVGILVDRGTHPTKYMSEDALYEMQVTAFMKAAEAGDEEAMFELFTASQQADPELRGQIEALMKAFPRPVDFVQDRLQTGSSSSWDDGKETTECSGWFYFVSGGENYYLNFDTTVTNDLHPEEVGITYVILWTEKTFCEKPKEFPEGDGVYVILENGLDYETRRIGGYPEIFVPYDRVITEQEVWDFLAGSRSLVAFREKFGEPNVDEENYKCVYEITRADGQIWYAELFYDSTLDSIEDYSHLTNAEGSEHIDLFEGAEE